MLNLFCYDRIVKISLEKRCAKSILLSFNSENIIGEERC